MYTAYPPPTGIADAPEAGSSRASARAFSTPR